MKLFNKMNGVLYIITIILCFQLDIVTLIDRMLQFTFYFCSGCGLFIISNVERDDIYNDKQT